MTGSNGAVPPSKSLTTSPQHRQLKKKNLHRDPEGATAGQIAYSYQHSGKALNDTSSILLEKRLFASRATKRLDLSIASQRVTGRLPLALAPFQVFPRAVLSHEQLSGHHLRELWLTNHRISILPPEISLFPQLRVLGLAGNGLSTLPPEIGELQSLEALYLEHNGLRVLPETVTFPRQLRDLRLDHNSLTNVPVQTTRLRLLQRLGLSHNRLTCLPVEMRRLSNLVELDVDHNRITTDGFPTDAIARLQHLERLGLDGNRLAERPACLLRMPNVRYVRLNGNRVFTEEDTEKDVGHTPSVPFRHDGYYQCVQGYQVSKAPGSKLHRAKGTAPPLDGLVPSRDQNLINAMQR
jgi:hypothetical protein